MEQFLANPENLTLVGVLVIAVIALWRLTSHYHKKNLEDIEKSRESIEKSNEETKNLLKQQNIELQKRNDLLVDRVKDEQIARKQEMNDHQERISGIINEYNLATNKFQATMSDITGVLRDVKSAMEQQTIILQDISTLPKEVDEIKESIKILRVDVEELKQQA